MTSYPSYARLLPSCRNRLRPAIRSAPAGGCRLLSHARDARLRPSLSRPTFHHALTSRSPSSPLPAASQTRGKKTKSSIKLAELPQGLITAAPLPDIQDDAGPAYPTVVLQARRNMQKFENCVLLTRVGGFYELYFQHAEEYGPLLNLKVAQKKTNAGPVPMAGFPFFQLERFLKTLVLDLNCYVAVAEEFPNDPGDKVKSGGLMHDRRVTRVITPGTLIDENFIDPYANNYVLAIHVNHESPPAPITGLAEHNHGVSDASCKGSNTSSTPIGLAWLDISTGQFYTQATSIDSLSSILSRVGPREIVVDELLETRKDHQVFSVLAEDKHLTTFASEEVRLPISEWGPMLESAIPVQTVAEFTPEESRAGSLLLQYVKSRLQNVNMKLQPPQRYENMSVLGIDKNTMRALEIKQTIKDGTFRGSLLHAVRRTVTKGGARLLNSWLSAPSTDLNTIQGRQDLVEYFIQHEDIRDDIVLLLRRSHDSQRLVQKFAFGRGDADDLVGLANTIRAAQDIVDLLTKSSKVISKPNTESTPESQLNACFQTLLSRIRLEEPMQLADRIWMSIDEEGITQQHQNEDSETNQILAMAEDVVAVEGTQTDADSLPKSKRKKTTSIREVYAEDNMAFIMKPQASEGLQELHTKLSSLLKEKDELADSLREELGAQTLTLRWTPNLGHICHVKGKDIRAAGVTSQAAVSSSRSTRAFHTAEWTALGRRIHQTRFEIGTEETRIFAELRASVVANLVKLRRNASVLDELDVTTSFARLAVEEGLTRPVLNSTTAHTIIGGRHPTVEGGLREQGRNFTRNDCLVGHATTQADGDSKNTPSSEGRLWLITGPNMAGKSTYLRQNALITILAQAGCYVPASHATLGIVDAVFSRVGSADNLYRDQSTFMVEMLETAAILRSATPRSFVIMDEIGRGTTPEDGEAVAFACLHHLATINRCRALFATHFHGLADRVRERGLHVGAGSTGPVEMYCTDVEEDGKGGFVYVHKLRKGVNRQSHALKVASLAGLPNAAITVAKEIIDHQRQNRVEENKTTITPAGFVNG
ncbi:muts domain V [Xylariaceae sp. FL1019]|nr:muts domain V [Xylariaceae sp. FL1019]